MFRKRWRLCTHLDEKSRDEGQRDFEQDNEECDELRVAREDRFEDSSGKIHDFRMDQRA